MTLREAVKSDKPFRHKSWDMDYVGWVVVGESGEIEFPRKDQVLILSQAISDDWEIQQKTTFTRADIERAIETYSMRAIGQSSHAYPQSVKEAMRAAEGEV